MLLENSDVQFHKTYVTLRGIQGPAAGLVGQAVFSFDRFSILGPALVGNGWTARMEGREAGTQYSHMGRDNKR